MKALYPSLLAFLLLFAACSAPGTKERGPLVTIRPLPVKAGSSPPAAAPGIDRSSPSDDMRKDLAEGPGAYASRSVRSQQETNRVYGYVFDRGTAARIESARVQPRAATAGDEIESILTYMVFTHSADPVEVTEVREIWFGERMVARSEVVNERHGGTYESSLSFRLPDNMENGAHKVVCIVRTRHSRDLFEAAFAVRNRQAARP